jgi:tripartite-type tricarboxylate transporter receptor subunit TctC
MTLAKYGRQWRQLLGGAALAMMVVFVGVASLPAVAANYPEKTVLALVPFGAGGGTDRWARVFASVGFDYFDRGLRVQNRDGASGTIGWKSMLDKGPDGHTLMFGSPTQVLAALIEKKPPFDPANLKIVAYYSVMKPTLIAPRNRDFSTWEGFLKHIKTVDKKLTIGGTMTQLIGTANALDQLGLAGSVVLVTYPDTGQAMNDYLRGHIDMAAITTSTAVTLMDKHTAVFNATDTDYPPDAKKIIGEVPNSKTLGLKPFNPPRFIGMHPDTPDEQVAIMSAKLGAMLKSKPVVNMLKKMGEEIVYVPHDAAQKAYVEILELSKKNVKLFK